MARTAPTDFECEAWDCGLRHVVGLDEVGCGPLAGPVVAGAVILHPRAPLIDGVFDSKMLSASQREAAAVDIRERVFAWALGAASTREIERFNIRRATILAMRRAIARLPVEPDCLLVDGRRLPGLGDHTAIVKGDQKSLSIACASILAKVVRDRLMRSLGARYPGYGWESNKGYATGFHLKAIRELGPTPHHRRTWTPIAQRELALKEVVRK